MRVLFLILLSINILQAQTLSNLSTCSAIPKFLESKNIKSKEVAYSTSEKKIKGVALIYRTSEKQIYQDTSWSQFGNMGPIALDEIGNAYFAPVPKVNVIDNIIEEQNKIFTINSNTGKMVELINLKNKNVNTLNPFGIIGLSYYCGKQILYASSIYGSTIDTVKGAIYGISLQTKKVITQLKNIDGFGICAVQFNNKPCLFFGNARNQNVYYVFLNSDGTIQQNINFAFCLVGLGPRGDDKAKKIRVNNAGELLVTAKPFYYNLTAPTDNQETVYKYTFDLASKKWKLLGMEHKGIELGYE